MLCYICRDVHVHIDIAIGMDIYILFIIQCSDIDDNNVKFLVVYRRRQYDMLGWKQRQPPSLNHTISKKHREMYDGSTLIPELDYNYL